MHNTTKLNILGINYKPKPYFEFFYLLKRFFNKTLETNKILEYYSIHIFIQILLNSELLQSMHSHDLFALSF